MFYVYILLSKKDFRTYVGYSNDWRRRLKEHNLGRVNATKHRTPLFLMTYLYKYVILPPARKEYFVERIPAPDVSTLTAVPSIQCKKLGGGIGWLVIDKLYGPEGIFTNEAEELFCKTEDAAGEEWWHCGDCRSGVEDRILELYVRYHNGTYLTIAWYKRSIEAGS